jgi:tetratricopeptide (TPR) repeat protein/SAM-dependent methyltransferase
LDHVSDLFAKALSHHKRGELREAEAGYTRVLALDPNHLDALHHLGIVALAFGRPDIAVELIGRAIALNGAIPECHYHIGIAFGSLGRFAEAALHNRQAIALRPDYAEAHLNLGNALKAEGKADEATVSYRRALLLAPQSHQTLYNLANLLSEQGRFDEAIQYYERAIKLKPDYAEAYNNLGTAWGEQGRLDDAIGLYHQALAINPRLQQAYVNLGDALRKQGDLKTALDTACHALSLAETHEAKALIYECLKGARAAPYLDGFRDVLIRAVSEHWGPLAPLASAVAHLFARDPAIAEIIGPAEDPGDVRQQGTDLLDPAGLGALVFNPLLESILLVGRVPHPGLERLLATIRAGLLDVAAQTELDAAADGAILSFGCKLARLCFSNEYVFSYSERERSRVAQLREMIAERVRTERTVPALWIAAMAAYLPLHALPETDALLGGIWPQPVQNLLTQQTVGPREIKAQMAEIAQLTPIEDKISLAVLQQYEENPYPRWEAFTSIRRKQTLQAHLRALFPQYPTAIASAGRELEYLVAGCGTGQHVLMIAQQFSNIRLTAIDLSRASLAYAKYMTAGLADISFAQADILKLGPGVQHFDVIDASGVLHHLSDWEAGWRSLLSILRPRGLMRVGLYSEIARQPVVAARRLIADRGFDGTPEGIRLCREEILALSPESPAKEIEKSWDFYSLSDCRDLLFHVQEHRLSIPQIARFLLDHRLELIGFELDGDVLQRYGKQFPDDKLRTNLTDWQAFEEQNPGTFAGMYQFWVQQR